MLTIIIEGDLRFLLGVILILLWLGKTYANERQKLVGGLIAIVAFLAFAAFAFERLHPRNAEELFHIALRALVTFGLTLGFSWIVLALLGGITRPIRDAMRRSGENARQRRREQQPAWRPAPEPEPLPPPPVVPPPTREELLTAAQQRYQNTLRLLATANLDDMELRSARERAKQQYLRELDEVMK